MMRDCSRFMTRSARLSGLNPGCIQLAVPRPSNAGLPCSSRRVLGFVLMVRKVRPYDCFAFAYSLPMRYMPA